MTPSRRFAALAPLLALALLLAAGAASAADAPAPAREIELILDASGSMLAQQGGEAKIAVAKRVLVELAEGLREREGLAVGVRVYGHQSDKSLKNCRDTRLEIPLGPPDAAKVRELAARTKAQGQTPIAFSLREARKDFGATPETKRSIVLITDGIESCDGDPCAAAKELAAKGIEVRIDVVGFDLAPGELEKLRCIAAPSGGQVLGAADASQLKGALGEIMQRQLAENLVFRVLGSDRQPVHSFIEIFAAGTGERVAAGAGSGKHTGFNLPAGSYDALVRNNVTNEKRRVAGIAVAAEKLTEKEIVFAMAGVGGIARALSGAPIPGRVEVFIAGAAGDTFVTAAESGEKPRVFDLPPGTYRVKIVDERTQEAKVFDGVVAVDGGQIVKEASFGEATITLAAKDAAGNPAPARAEIRRAAGEIEQFLKAGELANNPATFFVPPGTYTAVVVHEKTKEEKKIGGIALADGQAFTKEVVFGSAKLAGFAKDAAGQPVAATIEVTLVAPAGERTLFLEDNGLEPRVFTVAPGTYRMVFQRKGTGERRVIDGIVIGDGQEIRKEAVF